MSQLVNAKVLPCAWPWCTCTWPFQNQWVLALHFAKSCRSRRVLISNPGHKSCGACACLSELLVLYWSYLHDNCMTFLKVTLFLAKLTGFFGQCQHCFIMLEHTQFSLTSCVWLFLSTWHVLVHVIVLLLQWGKCDASGFQKENCTQCPKSRSNLCVSTVGTNKF